MRNTTLTIKGLWEFQEALSKMPEALTDEATDIVSAAANGARGDTYGAYPNRTGRLRGGLRVEYERSRLSTAAILKSEADHARAYEKGTDERRTRRGWSRGEMPLPRQGTAMLPIARRWRSRMMENLIAMVERAGFTVERR